MIKKQFNILGFQRYQSKYVGLIKIPIILCEERKDFVGGIKFFCPFCKKTHYHGGGEGHRVAHCHDPKSSFEKTGYIITKNKNYIKDNSNIPNIEEIKKSPLVSSPNTTK